MRCSSADDGRRWSSTAGASLKGLRDCHASRYDGCTSFTPNAAARRHATEKGFFLDGSAVETQAIGTWGTP